jgi:ribonuclease BN (tRNA processing enzyme)
VFLPEHGLIFDAGTSFFRVAPLVETDELDVFLSHAHLDHVVGLTFFLVPIMQKKVQKLRVHARPEFLSAVREHLYATALFPVEPNFEMLPLADRVPVGDGGVLTHCLLEHPGGSTGFRVDWPGRSLGVITDTTADGSCAKFVEGVDVLIHECNFGDDMPDLAKVTGHSHTTPVAQLAQAAGAGQLWLTHIDPEFTSDDPVGIETARSIFPATRYAEDNLVFDWP